MLVMLPHHLELGKVASRDWIMKDHIIHNLQDPLILDATITVCRYESTNVFRDE
jgi:hypothetical protein